MSRSIIQTVNQSLQAVTAGSTIALGSVLRRFGCNCRLNGNSVIELSGQGYYEVTAIVTLAPTASGNVSISLYQDGTPISGAVATGSVTTAGNSITLPLVTTVRNTCCCDSISAITCVLTSGTSTVSNISMRVEKL